MTNVEYEIQGEVLIIKVDTTKTYGPSSTGKSVKVASSNGFVNLEKGIMFSINVNKK